MFGFRSVSVDWIHVRPPISDSVLIHVLPRNGRRASSVGIPPFLAVLYSRVRGSRGTGFIFEPRFRIWPWRMPCRVMADGSHLLVLCPAFSRIPVCVLFCGLDSCSVADFGFSPDTCPAAEWPAGFICWYSAIPCGPVLPCSRVFRTGFIFEPRFRVWSSRMPCRVMADGSPLLVFRRFLGVGAPISDDLRPVARTESLIGIRLRV